MSKPKREVFKRQAYTMAVVENKHAEMTLYGDIVETRPIDWWTDEPVEGNFIMQDEFLNDLESIKGCEDLTIHLNSCGGDAFVSIAIHNRLREMSDAGMDITCIVDGAAMSGGSLIMCAADHVKVNPSSLILIHDCWSFAWDRFNSTKLRKLADDLDVINESQAEIYARKSGMDAKEIREMMAVETMMTGRSAVNKGLADELLENAEDADVAVSADHRTLIACGRKMRFAAFGKLPEGLKVAESIPEGTLHTQGEPGGDKKTPEVSGTEGGKKPMSLEEFRKENPEAAAALLEEARAEVAKEVAAKVDAAVEADRQRCQEIDELECVVGKEAATDAKYGNPCSAQELSYRATKEMAKQGQRFVSNMKADYQESGADGVASAPAAAEGDNRPMSNAEKIEAGRALAKKLRGEKAKEV